MNVLVSPETDAVDPLPPWLPAPRTAAPSAMKKNAVTDFFIFFCCGPIGLKIEAHKTSLEKLRIAQAKGRKRKTLISQLQISCPSRAYAFSLVSCTSLVGPLNP